LRFRNDGCVSTWQREGGNGDIVAPDGRGVSIIMADEQVPDYLRTHRLQDALLKFGVAFEAEQLRAQAVSSGTGRVAKTLVKEGPIRVTLVALRRGVVLEEHHVAGPVTIHVLHGAFRLSTAQGDTDVCAGELVALDAGIPHTAHALEDCALLLTVAMAR